MFEIYLNGPTRIQYGCDTDLQSALAGANRGLGCTGNRDLYDDFGIAVNPLTGLASIVYSDE